MYAISFNVIHFLGKLILQNTGGFFVLNIAVLMTTFYEDDHQPEHW